MKKIFFVYIFAAVFFSCEKDETLLKVNPEGDIIPPSIVSQSNGFTQVITDANRDQSIEFAWELTGYGIDTEVVYTLEVDTECGNFSSPVTIASTTNSSIEMTMEELSTKLVNDLKIAPHALSELQLRVKSTINDAYLSVSEPVQVNVTPWSAKPFGLWIGQGSTAQVILKKTGSTYEGYRYIQANTSFKFANNRLCANTFYGSASAGVLSSAETSNPIVITEAGYYKFNLDTENLSYQIVKINTWGLIGTATAGAWSTSTPMEYNDATERWEILTSLANGALKFRANDGWDINYGTATVNNLSGNLVFDADAINIADAGTYLIRIDFSRNTSPYTEYTYTVEKQPELARLWLPGGYQSYNPAAAPFIYATGATTFEGYQYIPSATGFKFTSAPDWNHTNYGYGGAAGALSTDGAAVDLDLTPGGYYKFNVNTAALTYSAVLIESWGLVGPATLGGSDAGWNSSVAMTYDPGTKLWTKTMDLTAGALKFRANNAWDINYGPADSNSLIGNLVITNGAITIPENGNYTVTLDFTRADAPHVYTYKVVKN